VKLIVTEKDSAARKIAEILGGKVTVQEHGRGRQKVRSYHFTHDGGDAVAIGLRGHVMETVFPNTYKRWSLKYLGDMIEKPDLAWVVDGGAAGTLAALRAVAKGATELVIATDYDREGELIGHEALEILRGDALELDCGLALLAALEIRDRQLAGDLRLQLVLRVIAAVLLEHDRGLVPLLRREQQGRRIELRLGAGRRRRRHRCNAEVLPHGTGGVTGSLHGLGLPVDRRGAAFRDFGHLRVVRGQA